MNTGKYHHLAFSTKRYRDRTCADFKLAEAYNRLTTKITAIFVRYAPKILTEKRYDRDITMWYGIFRVTVVYKDEEAA